MKKPWLGVTFLLVLAISGCSKDDATPSKTATATWAGAGAVARPLLLELAASPASFENVRVRVTGRYGVIPAPVCSGVLRLPPSTWALTDAGVVTRAAGLETVVLPLAPDELTMEVEGFWRRWEGLVGCGNSAVASTVWYLEVQRILSPNPIERATLTPLGWVGASETPESGTLVHPTVPYLTPTPLPSATPLVAVPAAPTPLPSPTNTTIPSPLATPTPSATSFMSPLATPTHGSNMDATVTPWPTFTALPTWSFQASPTASAIPSAVTIHMGFLAADEIVHETLEVLETHRWHWNGSVGDVITITVACAQDVDVELVLNDPEGRRLVRQGDRPAGQTETATAIELTRNGDYVIMIREVDGTAGSYALLIMVPGSPPIVFPGNLEFGDQVVKILPANTAHIWHFSADAGDTIKLTLEPNPESDGVMVLYGPEGLGDLIAEIDSGRAGQIEQRSLQLTVSGYYAVYVTEASGTAGSYRLSLNQ